MLLTLKTIEKYFYYRKAWKMTRLNSLIKTIEFYKLEKQLEKIF